MQTSELSSIAFWRMPLPWLALFATSVALIVGGLYYSANRVVALRADINELEARRDVLLGQIDSAQRTLSEVAAQAKRAVEVARERCSPTDAACQSVATVAAEVQATAASASRSIETVTALEPRPKLTPALGSVVELREQLNGKDRRQVSDDLAVEYGTNATAASLVVGSLAAASLPVHEKSAYRVNLYILRTLAKVQGGWSASSDADREALVAIANSEQLRKDKTYEMWADQALKNERRRK